MRMKKKKKILEEQVVIEGMKYNKTYLKQVEKEWKEDGLIR